MWNPQKLTNNTVLLYKLTPTKGIYIYVTDTNQT